MKKFIFLVFILMQFILYFQSAAQSPSQDLRKVTLQLKWKHQYQFAGYYAAIEKGFYEEAGFQVKLLEAVEGEEPGKNVFNGTAEFGVSSSDIVLLLDRYEAVILANIFQHSPHIIIASQESGIEHVHNLTGKRIATEPKAADIIAFLMSEGVSLDDCIVLPLSFDVGKLLEGEVDAISAYVTDEPYILRKAEFPYTIISPAMGGIDFYGDLLFTSKEMMESEPEMVFAFREASLRGWRYAMNNIDEMIDIIYERYSKRHTKEHLRFEAGKMKNLIMQDVVEIGYTNRGRWAEIINIYKRLELTNKSVSVEGLLYEDYLPEEFQLPWGLILLYSSLVFVLGGAVFFFYRTTRRLHSEILERKRIQEKLVESEEKFRSLFENTPFGLFHFNAAGKITFCNDSFVQIIGSNREALLGLDLTKLPDKRVCDSVDSALRGKAAGFEGLYHSVTADKKTSIRSQFIPILTPNGKFLGGMGIIEDITESVKAEQELRRSEADLRELNRQKDKFFSIIAHDLRSPFQGLIGKAEIIADEFQGLSQEEIASYSKDIVQSASSLYELLENLLEWSLMQQGTVDFQPELININNLIKQNIELIRETANQKEIMISFDRSDDMNVYADAKMINLVLRNLLSNAVKFTARGGTVSLKVSKSNASVLVEITDTGIGMPLYIKENLFKNDMKTGREGTEGEKSTGLGLLLCKEFVDKNKGDITVESKEGKGTIFRLTLPAAG